MTEFREIKLKDFYPCLGCGAKTEPWGVYETAQESPFCRACWRKMRQEAIKDPAKVSATSIKEADEAAWGKREPSRQFLTCCGCDTVHLVNVPADGDNIDGFLCKSCSRALAAEMDARPAPHSLPVRKRMGWAFPLALVIGMAWVACVIVAAVSAMVSVVRWAFGF
jgi:hypothetical protein